MKLDRNELRLEVAATREKLLRAQHEHKQNIMTLEQRLTEERDALELVESQLKILNLCVQAYLPDSEPPLAGGPVEPIQRRPKRDLLALTLDYVQKYPGNTAQWLALTIEQNTNIRTLPQPILNKLEHLKVSGNVRREKAGVSEDDDTWWPTGTFSEGPQDTESAAEAQPPTGSETPTTARAWLKGDPVWEAEEIDGRYRPMVREET